MTEHKVVGAEEWLEARKKLLEREKRLTRERADLARARQELPWERVEKPYVFDGPDGQESLGALFQGRSQLIIYHFMFAPDWEAGCKSCAFWADNFNGIIAHLHQRDVSFVAISRAPWPKLQAFQRRLGWSFKWLSAANSDFNFDYQVSFTDEALAAGSLTYNYAAKQTSQSESVGVSVFYRAAEGEIYHTYSCYARGVDSLNTAYQYLDLVPKGRDETDLPYGMAWVKFRDQYDSRP